MVSGNRNHAITKLTIHNPIASNPTYSIPKWVLTNPPTGGPKMNPRPNAAPINPIIFTLFSGVEISATAA